jgi:serine/threonine-protein kinase
MTPVGAVIGGRYRAESLLGSGGMAAVWFGRDLLLERPIAIKKLSGAGLTEPMAAERFEQEARTVARLAHPNVVAVHDFGTEDGEPYLIMELVHGETVADMLLRGPLTITRALAIAAQTCDGLAAAHAAGIVHRDIKPSNLILTPAGLVKICDFGIARMLHAAGQATLTGATDAVGSVSYMAPEQVGDQPIDHRVDLYGLGCTLYAMLAGTPPFLGETPMGILHQHLTRPPEPLTQHRADVPPGIEALVDELLAKTPQARPADATQVKDRLIAAMPNRSDPLVAAVPEAAELAAVRPGGSLFDPTTMSADATVDIPPGRPDPWWRANGRGLAIAAVVGLLVVGAFMLGLSQVARTGAASDGSAAAAGVSGTATPAMAGSPQPSAGQPSDGPAITPTTTPPAPAVGAGSTTPVEPIAAMRVSIQRQVGTGDLTPNAATDLYKKVDEIARELNEGDIEEATKKISDLRRKLSDLLDDGKLTPAGHGELSQRLDAVAALTGDG